ncbi:hypothetical protein Tco_0393305 [Tanacetum coccineum]
MAIPKLVGEAFYTCTVRVKYKWKPSRCACCKFFSHVQDGCPKNIYSYMVKNMKNPCQTPRGVPVGPKVGFKLVKQVYRQVSKKNNVNTSGNKKKDVEPTIEVTLADDEGKPLAKVDSLGDHDSEDEVASVDNEMEIFLALKKGQSSYARALIEVHAKNDLKDNLILSVENLYDEGYTRETISIDYESRPPHCKELALEVSGLMAYFVTILTPDSARSCVMQCTLPTQGMRSIIFMVSISPEGFLPSILLLVVIIVTVVIVVVTVILVVVVVAIIGVVIVVTIGVVVVVVVSSIIKLSFVIIGSLLSIVLCYLIH